MINYRLWQLVGLNGLAEDEDYVFFFFIIVFNSQIIKAPLNHLGGSNTMRPLASGYKCHAG